MSRLVYILHYTLYNIFIVNKSLIEEVERLKKG